MMGLTALLDKDQIPKKDFIYCHQPHWSAFYTGFFKLVIFLQWHNLFRVSIISVLAFTDIFNQTKWITTVLVNLMHLNSEHWNYLTSNKPTVKYTTHMIFFKLFFFIISYFASYRWIFFLYKAVYLFNIKKTNAEILLLSLTCCSN